LKHILWLAAFFLHPAFCMSQQAMETDRPDQVENTHVLNPRELQLETGFIANRHDGNNEYIGRGLARYGAFHGVELRLLLEDGKDRDTYIEETAQGNFPLAVGGKLSIVEGKPSLPDITLIAYLKLPFTSHTGEQAKYWSPAAILAFSNALSPKIDVNYNIGIKQDAFDNMYAWQSAIALQWKVSEKYDLFVEYFGQYQDGSLPEHNADAGMAYLITNNIQVDFALGSGIGDNEFITTGLPFVYLNDSGIKDSATGWQKHNPSKVKKRPRYLHLQGISGILCLSSHYNNQHT